MSLAITSNIGEKVFHRDSSSRSQMFFKIGVLKNFPNFTGKHLCWSLFFIRVQFIKKGLQDSYFPVNIAKFLRAAFLWNTSRGCFCRDAFVLLLFITFISLVKISQKLVYQFASCVNSFSQFLSNMRDIISFSILFFDGLCFSIVLRSAFIVCKTVSND